MRCRYGKRRSSKEQDQQTDEKKEESKWVSDIRLCLCHHLQGERVLCLSPLIASCRCQFQLGCLDAQHYGCHFVVKPIQMSTYHLPPVWIRLWMSYVHIREPVCTPLQPFWFFMCWFWGKIICPPPPRKRKEKGKINLRFSSKRACKTFFLL